jgi:hypothetical protein
MLIALYGEDEDSIAEAHWLMMCEALNKVFNKKIFINGRRGDLTKLEERKITENISVSTNINTAYIISEFAYFTNIAESYLTNAMYKLGVYMCGPLKNHMCAGNTSYEYSYDERKVPHIVFTNTIIYDKCDNVSENGHIRFHHELNVDEFSESAFIVADKYSLWRGEVGKIFRYEVKQTDKKIIVKNITFNTLNGYLLCTNIGGALKYPIADISNTSTNYKVYDIFYTYNGILSNIMIDLQLATTAKSTVLDMYKSDSYLKKYKNIKIDKSLQLKVEDGTKCSSCNCKCIHYANVYSMKLFCCVCEINTSYKAVKMNYSAKQALQDLIAANNTVRYQLLEDFISNPPTVLKSNNHGFEDTYIYNNRFMITDRIFSTRNIPVANIDKLTIAPCKIR